jgi:4-hydroxybenzoate polyprenyltransferase
VLLAQEGVFSRVTVYFGTLVGLSAAIIGSGGNIINDILDFETDKINRPNRPIPSGLVSIKSATRLYILTKIFGIFIAAMIGIVPAIIATATSFIIFIYSSMLKSIPLVGNITVSFFTGLVFVFGASAVNNYSNALFPFIFSFLINLIRELVKDIEDITGDKETGVKTFPVFFGIELSKKVLVALTVFLIVTTFIPFLLQVYKIEYLVLIALSVNPALVSSLKSILNAKEKKDYSIISRNLKIIMIMGIFAILIGI